MNYKKVIKDLKERNDKLQEQYRLRDIRCIHLEYENEMLKGDFEAQHELTKKYAKENKELKEELEKEYNKGYERGILDTVEENQRLDKENRELKKQLEYLRSGEYYNQLRFENEMLQQVVDTNGVPSEVYDYIDCTHRNTELLEENQELKKQLHEASIEMQEMIEQDIECPSNCSKLKEILNQQKEFIEYLTSYIDLLSNNPDLIEEAEIDILEEILSKYKEIIGVSDETN